jgi:hypothetical protein
MHCSICDNNYRLLRIPISMAQLHVIVKTPVVHVLLASTLLVHVTSLVTKKDKTRQEK